MGILITVTPNVMSKCTCTLKEQPLDCPEHDNRSYTVRSEEEADRFKKENEHLRCSCEGCHVKYWNIETYSTDSLCDICARAEYMKNKPPSMHSNMHEAFTSRFLSDAEQS